MSVTVYYNGTQITGEAFEVSIRRGRSRELDEFQAASGYVRVRNHARNFDPPFFTTPSYLLMETGDFLLLETGDRILLDQGSVHAGAYGAVQLGYPMEVRDGAVVVYSGHVEDVRYQWTRDGDAIATFVLGDALSTLARTKFQTEVTFTDDQLPGVRIAAILDRSDVAYPTGATYRSLSNGTSTMIGNTVAAGTNVLGELQLVSRSDFGKLYTDRQGKLVYKGRYDYPAASSADFKDDGTAFSFSGVEVAWGSESLYYQASVSRQVVLPDAPDFGVIPPPRVMGDDDPITEDSGGTPRTATSALTPPTRIGARNITITGLLLRGDGECEARARYLADRYSSPEAVVSGLTTILNKFSTANRATVAALDIHDVITLTWTPKNTGVAVTQTLVIEGVEYTADVSGLATVTYQLSAVPDSNYFLLDTDSLDSGVLLGF